MTRAPTATLSTRRPSGIPLDRSVDYVPFTSFDSAKPEDLWTYLASYEKGTGGSVLAIPHNSNLTNGRMFAVLDSDLEALTREYTSTRRFSS